MFLMQSGDGDGYQQRGGEGVYSRSSDSGYSRGDSYSTAAVESRQPSQASDYRSPPPQDIRPYTRSHTNRVSVFFAFHIYFI